MLDDDPMIESAELRILRDALTAPIPEPPPLEAIRVRGRAHVRRRQRLFGAGVVLATGAVAATALTIALTQAPGHVPAPGPSRTSIPETIRTPSYSLVSDTSGAVRLTINPSRLFDPARLQHDLARVDIPAKVTDGSFCTSDPTPSGLSRVVSIGTGRHQTITFRRSAIPSGTKLSFARFRLSGDQLAEVALIDKRSYTCSSSVPTGVPAPGTRVGYIMVP
jgi:hypothetical protein